MLAKKRTREKREEIVEENRRRDDTQMKDRDENAKRQRKVRRHRHKITLGDFPLGRGVDPYNLGEDLRYKKPDITYP